MLTLKELKIKNWINLRFHFKVSLKTKFPEKLSKTYLYYNV